MSKTKIFVGKKAKTTKRDVQVNEEKEQDLRLMWRAFIRGISTDLQSRVGQELTRRRSLRSRARETFRRNSSD